MRVAQVKVSYYRSIENIVLYFPENKPLVLFGPNNAGKSNILSAINRILGERYPTYVEMQDSDYFQRDRADYPTVDIAAVFSEPLYYDRNFKPIQTVAVRYGNNGNINDNILHNGQGIKIFPTNDQRAACQSFLIDAERNIQSAFNYSSQYSLLSKFSKRIHSALSSEHKEDLSKAFEEIKSSFEKTVEFKGFFDEFSNAIKGSVKGFVHSLAVDFSAYDPNNYAKSLSQWNSILDQADTLMGFQSFDEFFDYLVSLKGKTSRKCDFLYYLNNCGADFWKQKQLHEREAKDLRKWTNLVRKPDMKMLVIGY